MTRDDIMTKIRTALALRAEQMPSFCAHMTVEELEGHTGIGRDELRALGPTLTEDDGLVFGDTINSNYYRIHNSQTYSQTYDNDTEH